MPEITPPKYVITILKKLSAHGYTACIVGGCVRDMILGERPNDWDIASNAMPEEVMRIFPGSIPTGIKHGTITVKSGSKFCEVTTFRAESGTLDHRHPENVSFVGDLAADLARRDFTMNAIALTSDGQIFDPFGGTDAIRRRSIQCVGNPDERFQEDALRMFRAYRFAARLGFSIEEKTVEAIHRNAAFAASLSAERVQDELEKILLTQHPEILFSVIQDGLLDSYLHHPLSRDDGLKCLAVMNRKPLPRRAAFCAILEADGCIDSAESFLRALKCDSRTIRCCSDACQLLKEPSPTDWKEWKRCLYHYGVDSVECAAFCWDALYVPGHSAMLKKVLKSGECFSVSHLAVNGNDLISLGLSGKEIGEAMDFLVDYVIDFPQNNERSRLLSLLTASYE